jgi:hypothetical protein
MFAIPILQDRSIMVLKWGLNKKLKKVAAVTGEDVPTIDDGEYDEVEVVEQVSEAGEPRGGASVCLEVTRERDVVDCPALPPSPAQS